MNCACDHCGHEFEADPINGHRLLCGDSTSADDMNSLMGDDQAAMLFADPPYGVSYGDKNAFLNQYDNGDRVQTPIENDHLDPDAVQQLWHDAFSLACGHLRPGGAYYVTGPQGGDLLLLALRESGLQLKHMLIWAKNNHVLGRCDYHYKHEPIIYGWREGAGHKFYGKEGCFSLWEIARPHKSKLHPTMKPVELVAKAVRNSTRPGEIVLDPFCGSGTTIIAAEQLGRTAYGMEMSPTYCDVIINRWQEVNGCEATLDGDGRTFTEIKSERLGIGA